MILRPDPSTPINLPDLEVILPRELICRDFEAGCYRVKNPQECKKGRSVRINDVLYFTLPIQAVCPLADCEK